MKLFFKQGACSLASHIILREAGLDHVLEEVDTDTKQTQSGQDYLQINPKGYVPALQLNNGDILTEGASVLQYLGDVSDAVFVPENGTVEKARLQEYLNYTSSELHKAFGPLFNSASTDQQKQAAKEAVAEKFNYVESLFQDGRIYLLGGLFSVADAYLFVVCNWANFVGIDLENWPKLAAFIDRVAQREATQEAMKAEGLIS